MVLVVVTTVDEKVRRGLYAVVPFAPVKEAVVVEHVLGQWVQRPVVVISRVARLPKNVNKALVK